jgi:hypothetical protein
MNVRDVTGVCSTCAANVLRYNLLHRLCVCRSRRTDVVPVSTAGGCYISAVGRRFSGFGELFEVKLIRESVG